MLRMLLIPNCIVKPTAPRARTAPEATPNPIDSIRRCTPDSCSRLSRGAAGPPGGYPCDPALLHCRRYPKRWETSAPEMMPTRRAVAPGVKTLTANSPEKLWYLLNVTGPVTPTYWIFLPLARAFFPSATVWTPAAPPFLETTWGMKEL